MRSTHLEFFDPDSDEEEMDLLDPEEPDPDSVELKESSDDLGEESESDNLEEDPESEDQDQGEGSESDDPGEGSEGGELGDVLYSDSEDEGSSSKTGKSTIESAKDSDVEIGKAVRNQLRIWDGLLCLRIRLQKILIEANKLPNPELFARLKNFSQSKESSSDLGLSVEKSYNSFSVLTSNLLSMQELMILNNPETKDILKKSKKVKDSSGNKSDEEASSEDEDLKRIENEDSDKDSDDEKDDDNGDNESAGKQGKSQKRKNQNVNYAEEIHNLFQSLIPFRNETIEKWNTKTEVATGKFKGKANFASFNISALKQINQIMSDKERLIRRTQLKRSQYSIIGESELDDEKNKAKKLKTGELNGQTAPTAAATKTDDYNEEIFDDDDFYHQLLREVIESKTSNVLDPTELSTRWLELQKIRGKTKRKVDTKSSKGRKIRYAVLPKLVNFMAPHDECPMTENAYKELLNSLFANASI